MSEFFINELVSVLTSNINNSQTTIPVSDVTGLPTSGFTFRLVVDQEIMIGSVVSGLNITVARGQEGSAAASHLSGASVINSVTAGALAQFKTDLEVYVSEVLEEIYGALVGPDCSAGGTITYDWNGSAGEFPVALVNLTGTPSAPFVLAVSGAPDMTQVFLNETGQTVTIVNADNGLGYGGCVAIPPGAYADVLFSPSSQYPVITTTEGWQGACIQTTDNTPVDIFAAFGGLTGFIAPGNGSRSPPRPAISDLELVVFMVDATTGTSAGKFVVDQSWMFTTVPSIVAMDSGTFTETGTNSGSPPVGWNVTVTTGNGESPQIMVTGDASHTVNITAYARVRGQT